jgi:SAM-dependent methyltransferase
MKTSKDFWIETGKSNPWWGVQSHDRFKGQDIDESLKHEFYSLGDIEIAEIVKVLNWLCGFKGTDGNAIDFGSGLGRHTFPMSKLMGKVYGVDISPDICLKTKEMAHNFLINNVSFSVEIPDIKADWINSFIVFQHIPPKIGYKLLEKLMRCLNLGGVFSLHFTIYRHQEKFKLLQVPLIFDGESIKLLDDVAVTEMPMYDYNVAIILMILQKHGVGEFMCRHIDHSGAHGIWLFGRKNE